MSTTIHMMSLVSSQQSFLTNALSTSTHKPKRKILNIPLNTATISCKYQPHDLDDFSSQNENQLGKLAIVTLAAGVLTLGSVDPASAAKTGGRVGGQAFRSSAPRSSSPSSPRINNSRTNVYINPPLAPPLVGGYGYGFGVPFYGGGGYGYGFGPSVAIGIGGGFEIFALFILFGAVAAVIRRFREEEDDY
ncbi:uncharacterized protein LOC132300726 isoform X1 [Cornus florida]|uniref:uncharacterized protein LOC132300726 isoform X1 n=1 Tax=Cornus florida TaxID=4283 RepID=UPI002897B1DC|nr:uncharacterized protein LOC132300726 isoform X1 [Cornus florida]